MLPLWSTVTDPLRFAAREEHSVSGTRLSERTRGFTLTELLVVLSIISLLAALLLPALASARTAAHVARCSNNQRQIALAITLFASDAGYFPLGITFSLDAQQTRFWLDDVQPYIKSSWPEDNWRKRALPTGVFACPSYNSVCGFYGYSKTDWPSGSYGYNYYGIRGTPVCFLMTAGKPEAEGVFGLGLGGEMPGDRVDVATKDPLSWLRPIREALVTTPSAL